MKTSDFYYDLPEELIAQHPLDVRSSSRLLVLDKNDGSLLHRHFFDIKKFLVPGDVLVLNNTRVIPARLMGVRSDTGSAIEILLLKRLDEKRWETLARPGKKVREGRRVTFIEGELEAECEAVLPDGNRIMRFEYDGIWEEVLDRAGTMPLPPYIHEQLKDKERYQTVYSKIEGSAAAPTAGLHFTPELLQKLKDMGVVIVNVLLHIGLGTFRPVKAENIEEHEMHSEYYVITKETADIINAAKKDGRRVICVGTTSVRVLETVADENGFVKEEVGNTQIFIYPGYKYKAVDGLITNFHLPESTLIMLVSALVGREKTLEIYNEAVKERYRFFSFGDACFFNMKQ